MSLREWLEVLLYVAWMPLTALAILAFYISLLLE